MIDSWYTLLETLRSIMTAISTGVPEIILTDVTGSQVGTKSNPFFVSSSNPPQTVVVEQAVRLVRLGQSGTKRALREMEDVIIWAGLIRVNDERPKKRLQGFTKVKVDRSRRVAVGLVEGVSSRVRKAWEDVKITVKRIK